MTVADRVKLTPEERHRRQLESQRRWKEKNREAYLAGKRRYYHEVEKLDPKAVMARRATVKRWKQANPDKVTAAKERACDRKQSEIAAAAATAAPIDRATLADPRSTLRQEVRRAAKAAIHDATLREDAEADAILALLDGSLCTAMLRSFFLVWRERHFASKRNIYSLDAPLYDDGDKTWMDVYTKRELEA